MRRPRSPRPPATPRALLALALTVGAVSVGIGLSHAIESARSTPSPAAVPPVTEDDPPGPVFSPFDRCNLAQQVQAGFERRCAFEVSLAAGARTRVTLEEAPAGTATQQTLRIGVDWSVAAKGPGDRFLQLLAYRPIADAPEHLAYVVTRSGLQEAVVIAMIEGRMREVLHVRGLRGGGRIEPIDGGVAVAENFCPPGTATGCPVAVSARAFAWSADGYTLRGAELRPTPTPRP